MAEEAFACFCSQSFSLSAFLVCAAILDDVSLRFPLIVCMRSPFVCRPSTALSPSLLQALSSRTAPALLFSYRPFVCVSHFCPYFLQGIHVAGQGALGFCLCVGSERMCCWQAHMQHMCEVLLGGHSAILHAFMPRSCVRVLQTAKEQHAHLLFRYASFRVV